MLLSEGEFYFVYVGIFAYFKPSILPNQNKPVENGHSRAKGKLEEVEGKKQHLNNNDMSYRFLIVLVAMTQSWVLFLYFILTSLSHTQSISWLFKK